MVRYPVALEPDDNGTLMVTFPDFPEAHTFGENEADALSRASDALATIVDGYIRARRPLPSPSRSSGRVAELSALMSTKVALYNAMLALGVTKSALGRRLNWHPPQVDRLLTLTHSSRMDQLDAAARALGGSLTIDIHVPQRPRVVDEPRRRALSLVTASTPKGSAHISTAHSLVGTRRKTAGQTAARKK